MRAVAVVAGLIGFATIAVAGEGVLVTAPTRTWEAEYVNDPGAADQSMEHVAITRKLKFYYADASLDGSNPPRMTSVDDDNIREYLSNDVQVAIDSAGKEASAKKKKVQDLLPGYLSKLRFKTVDCRQVARTMVETLIGNRVKETQLSDGSSSRQYVKNEVQMEVAMTAKQLDAITIMRDPTIGTKDIDPRFTCRETAVSGTSARCGDLRLRFNPLEAEGGVFKGKKTVVFNPDTCAQYPDMSFETCELLVQVQRCGLRYTEKADGKRAGNASTWGLADFLEKARERDVRTYEAGLTDEVPAESTAAVVTPTPDSFYNGFKSPNDPGASRPAN